MSRVVSDRERGMILVNVLLFIAIASGIVMLMIATEDDSLARSLALREAARAQAILDGAELSAIAALRRDALAAPQSDSGAEPWAKIGERSAPIEGGTFQLAIADAQSGFNVNRLASGNAIDAAMLARIVTTLRLPPALIPRATELVRIHGPLADLRPLRLGGLDAKTYARLSGLLTALPYEGRINLNAASEEMLAILLDDPRAAAALALQRQRQGFLTPIDFLEERATIPPNAGFTSDLFWVRARVTIGETSQQRTTLLARRRDDQGRIGVAPIARWRGSVPPDQAPEL
jgi:general secretion pathway protein K